jgi:UDP-N-acetylglucosamine diphosphorylase / glucose-1-phosphate thymidylyltransferase / UDP-N-acetylgalactosamine diphosphorylase / glucosamine-1-phosphate N-acetyltransferase / galactosamine-1-phosphate N-acetyltransferase
MNVVYINPLSTCESFLDYDDSEIDKGSICSNNSLSIFGKPIISRNMDILDSLYNVDKIVIPKKMGFLTQMINTSHPGFTEVIDDKDYEKLIDTEFDNDVKKSLMGSPNGCENNLNMRFNQAQSVIVSDKSSLLLPINSILEKNSSKKKLKFQMFRYPWEFLEIVNDLLQSEIKETCISNTSSIAKSSIIDGPCIIDDGVTIDDFAKVKGPVYIGKGSFIGMGSLIRNSMLNYNTSIGFNCEIGKSYFAGNDKISHHNVILDSIIGKNVWFGGYSGTANVLLNRKNVCYKSEGRLIDTGKAHFGAVVSNNSSIGAAVIILPGRKIPPDSVIQAGTIFEK